MIFNQKSVAVISLSKRHLWHAFQSERLRGDAAAKRLRMPKEKKLQPPQHQNRQPGREYKMKPRPRAENGDQPGCGKLNGKVAIITGGDSGIGRAVAIAFAKEGADVTVSYLNEHKDAKETRRLVEEEERHCELIAGDIGAPKHCREAARRTMQMFG